MGHPPEVVWGYTQKQMQAFLFIADKRREREERTQLALIALGQGEEKAIKAALRDGKDEFE